MFCDLKIRAFLKIVSVSVPFCPLLHTRGYLEPVCVVRFCSRVRNAGKVRSIIAL